VGIDFEGNVDVGSGRCSRETMHFENAEHLVARGLPVIPLEDPDLDARLIVISRGEGF
jgi:hypothetical protein